MVIIPCVAKRHARDVRKVLGSLSQPPKGELITLYQEFSNLSTIALIAELRRYLPETEKGTLDQVLAHLSGIYIRLGAEKVALSNVKGVAEIIFRDLMVQRWKDSNFYFTDCPFC